MGDHQAVYAGPLGGLEEGEGPGRFDLSNGYSGDVSRIGYTHCMRGTHGELPAFTTGFTEIRYGG